MGIHAFSSMIVCALLLWRAASSLKPSLLFRWPEILLGRSLSDGTFFALFSIPLELPFCVLFASRAFPIFFFLFGPPPFVWVQMALEEFERPVIRRWRVS